MTHPTQPAAADEGALLAEALAKLDSVKVISDLATSGKVINLTGSAVDQGFLLASAHWVREHSDTLAAAVREMRAREGYLERGFRMIRFILNDADTGEELEDMPALSGEVCPRVGEAIHIWEDNFPNGTGRRWDFIVDRVRHDFRIMTGGAAKCISVVELFVQIPEAAP
jgi:hypothetical protein